MNLRVSSNAQSYGRAAIRLASMGKLQKPEEYGTKLLKLDGFNEKNR
jgi:hypothetical protein